MASVLLAAVSGCSSISEVRWKVKFGPEYRSKGAGGTNSTRWSVQTGPQVKFENGWVVGVTCRHRWEDEKTDDGIWVEVSFPIYKKSRADKLREKRQERDEMQRRLEALERRVGAGFPN